jgi:outer membrane protein assembly factor BamB
MSRQWDSLLGACELTGSLPIRHSFFSSLIINVSVVFGCAVQAPSVVQTPNLPEVTISLQGDDLVQSEPLFRDGKAYFSDVSGNVYSYEVASGRQLWRHSIGAAALSSPTLAGELLVVGGNDGALHALDIDTGEERWAYDVSGGVATKPAFASGFVVFGSDDGGVYSLNADSGSLEWSVQTGAAVRSSPVVNADTVFVGSDDNHVYGLALGTGSITWRFRTSGSVRSAPTVSEGVLLFGSQDNYVYALDVSTRRQIWRRDTGYAITASPTVSRGAVIQGNARGDLFSLNMATGSVNWQVEAGGPITSTVAMSDGRLIVGTEHKSINGFGQNGGRLWEVPSRDAIIGGGVESEYGYCVGSHKSIICLQGGAESTAAPDPIESSNTEDERPMELSDCEVFRGDATRYGYCRVQVAANTDLSFSADETCGDSRDWQAACRQAWAVSRAEWVGTRRSAGRMSG